ARVKRDARLFDALAAGEVAANIKKHFIRLNIGMRPGNADRFRMRVQHPRREGADDESRSVKSLMDRRRLVESAGDRLEVIGIECRRVKQAVPANHIEGMVGQSVASQPPAVLDEHRYI